jgi:hypothetical protein
MIMTGFDGTPPVGPDRDVVALDDALIAIAQVAAVVDEQLEAGKIPLERAELTLALLVVIRERIHPLPANTPPGEPDPYTADLRTMVQAIRDGMEMYRSTRG